jgi:hypothetical protein
MIIESLCSAALISSPRVICKVILTVFSISLSFLSFLFIFSRRSCYSSSIFSPVLEMTVNLFRTRPEDIPSLVDIWYASCNTPALLRIFPGTPSEREYISPHLRKGSNEAVSLVNRYCANVSPWQMRWNFYSVSGKNNNMDPRKCFPYHFSPSTSL